MTRRPFHAALLFLTLLATARCGGEPAAEPAVEYTPAVMPPDGQEAVDDYAPAVMPEQPVQPQEEYASQPAAEEYAPAVMPDDWDSQDDQAMPMDDGMNPEENQGL